MLKFAVGIEFLPKILYTRHHRARSAPHPTNNPT